MEDLNSVKSWEQRLRKEIDGLKSCKDQVLADSAIPKQVKDRFIDVLRTLKMNMIQVLAKCTQLRNESLPAKAMKVRAEKLKFEYEEVTKNLEQLQSTLNAKSSNGHGGFRNQSRDEEIHTVVAKELMEIREIISKAQEDLETHSHQDYEQRIEILESENQELRRNLNKIHEDNTETFEILHMLKKRVEMIENNQYESRSSLKSNAEAPKKRILLRPSSRAEDMLKT